METNLAVVAKRLEDAGKITRKACIAILNGDENTYNEEMINAAQKVVRGQSPYFLSKSEIRELRDRCQNQQLAPVNSESAGEKLFGIGAKCLILHATGLFVPYLAYKAYDTYNAVKENRKTIGGVAAALTLAAFIGIDSDDIV